MTFFGWEGICWRRILSDDLLIEMKVAHVMMVNTAKRFLQGSRARSLLIPHSLLNLRRNIDDGICFKKECYGLHRSL